MLAQLARVSERLGVAPAAVVRAYFPPSLAAPLYTDTLAGGDPDRFVPPAGVAVRILDPATLAEQPAGTPGRIAVTEAGSEPLLAADLGIAEGGGFRLTGTAIQG